MTGHEAQERFVALLHERFGVDEIPVAFKCFQCKIHKSGGFEERKDIDMHLRSA